MAQPPYAQGVFPLVKPEVRDEQYYNTLAQLLPRECMLLDLACGDGAFLRVSLRRGAKRAAGVELTEDGVLGCVAAGLSVHQGDITEGLEDYPDNSFDCVSLIRTVELMSRPEPVLAEMLRVGRQALLSFTNYGHWRHRLRFALKGVVPGTDQSQLGGAPARLTLPLLRCHCRRTGISLRQLIALPDKPLARLWPGLFARELAVVLVQDPSILNRWRSIS